MYTFKSTRFRVVVKKRVLYSNLNGFTFETPISKLNMLKLHNDVLRKLLKQENMIIEKIKDIHRSKHANTDSSKAKIQEMELELVRLDDRIRFLFTVNFTE